MDEATNELVKKYEAGGDVLRQAVKGLERDDLLAHPVPGTWSIQELVIHLADAEAAFADRIKRILSQKAGQEPALLAWDENRFVAALHYAEQSAADAVEGIALTRRQVTTILRHVPPSAFALAGNHDQRGRQTVVDVLNYAVNHLEHHLKFLIDKREKLGKLMW